MKSGATDVDAAIIIDTLFLAGAVHDLLSIDSTQFQATQAVAPAVFRGDKF